MPRILIADDHGLYRRGLRMALESAMAEVQVIEANCIDAALSQLEDSDCVDAALVDLHMNGLISLSVLKEVRDSYPGTRFVIISASDSRADILDTLDAGLHGFISKAQSDEEIVAAVTDILTGRIYVPPVLARGPIRMAGEGRERIAGERSAIERSLDLQKLTPRQRDVLDLIAEGLSNKEIARRLKIAEATTKIHVAALMRALDVRNRTEAAVFVKSWLDAQPL